MFDPVSATVRVCACVPDNFNVGKRARNYRKKHLSRGKIIKSTHIHRSTRLWKTPPLVASGGGAEKPVGTENQFQFVFPAADTRAQEARQAENWKFPTAKTRSASAQFASDLALIFSVDFHRQFSTERRLFGYFCAVRRQVRRHPDTTSGKSKKNSEPTSNRTGLERGKALKCHAVKWKSQIAIEKKCSKKCKANKKKSASFSRKILPPSLSLA